VSLNRFVRRQLPEDFVTAIQFTGGVYSVLEVMPRLRIQVELPKDVLMYSVENHHNGRQSGHFTPLNLGDWLVRFPSGSIQKWSDKEFQTSFIEHRGVTDSSASNTTINAGPAHGVPGEPAFLRRIMD